MSSRFFTGDAVADALTNLTLDLDRERDRLRGVIHASLGVGRLRRADLAKLGAVLVEIAALRDVERVILPRLEKEEGGGAAAPTSQESQ